jgi:predicted dehydrogenase
VDVVDVHTRKTSEYRGTDGVIIAPDSPEELLVQKRGETEEITVGAVGSHGGDVYQMRRFLRCLQGTADPPATAVDAKKAAAVSLAAERSIERDGAVVEIDGNYDLV